jgi:DNA-3-methyladenine glycosylase II
MGRSPEITARIIEIEKRFEPVIAAFGAAPFTSANRSSQGASQRNFEALAKSILSQQLSTKAAATIIARVESLSGGLTPKKILQLSERQIRGAGASSAKARGLHELAEAATEIGLAKIHLIEDDSEIFKRLLPIFGIGRWTVEMFLIFQLARPDIWPVADLGVRRGWEKIHRMRSEITPKQLAARGEKFAPYRSHVAWYCWRALEM